MKNLVKGMDVSDPSSIPKYLVVLIAQLCSNDVENPLQDDKYTMKPAWQAVNEYLEQEQDEVFAMAVVNIWNGTDLTEEEDAAIQAILKGQQQ